MNERIENLKNWAKKHKKAIILTASGAAAGIGVLVFRNHYYVVSRKLSKQFEDLSAAVENMQIVLDTGTLVGQTSAKMDAQLGTAAARRERAN